MTDLMGCLGCPGEYQVGLAACPWCSVRSPMFQRTEGVEMPTITSGGASNAGEAAETAGVEGVAAEAAAEVEAAPVPADAEAVAPAEDLYVVGGGVHGNPDLTVLREAPATETVLVGESGPEFIIPQEPAVPAASESIEPAAEEEAPVEDVAEPETEPESQP